MVLGTFLGPYSPETSLRPVFAAKTQCCTQTPGALCPLQVAAAPSPINGKARCRCSGERILCGALLLLLPVTALVTLVAPLCFLPTTDSARDRPHKKQSNAHDFTAHGVTFSPGRKHMDGPEVNEQSCREVVPLPLVCGTGLLQRLLLLQH